MIDNAKNISGPKASSSLLRASLKVLPLTAVLVALVASVALTDEGKGNAASTDAKSASAPAWAKGPLVDKNFFPLAVWMQGERNAAKFKAIGINVYVAANPDEKTLGTLKKLGMSAVCVMNDEALKRKDDPTIIAWMHGDEPDNAQDIKRWKSAEEIKKAWPESPDKPLEKWGQYGPPIPPNMIVADYKKFREADPSRPILLNLGQGVAWEAYYGRGYRTGKLEDYPEYIKGCDIVSFDIYPANHDKPAVKDKLEFVAQGVDRLVKWTDGKKGVWNCIECTAFDNPQRKPTTAQVRSEVWMSLIHGSKGIIYFVHIFKPKFIEPGVLSDKEMADSIAVVNKQIIELAPVINSPTIKDVATVTSSDKDAPIDIMCKKADGAVYVFAVGMRNASVKGEFQVRDLAEKAVAEVLGEDRKLDVSSGKFTDEFKPYDVHIYKISPVK